MKLEINAKCEDLTVEQLKGTGIMVTPAIDEDYWLFRVVLSENQAIVGFPKFFTIGIGFQQEKDWNTNLPYTSTAEDIFTHISHNKGDDTISDQECIEAIQLVKDATVEYMEKKKEK